MAKKKVCSMKSISFKTKRGRVVKFTGRPSGAAGCGKKRRRNPNTPAQRAVRSAFRTATKACKGKGLKSFRKCMKSKLH